MYIWGTVNPTGECDSHTGYLFTKADLRNCIADGNLIGKPVKIEHKGIDVGRVISAWQNNAGALDCILQIDENRFEGNCISKFVQDGTCRELSLGYIVSMQHSQNQQGSQARKKEITEISIVKKGARDSCFIHGFGKA